MIADRTLDFVPISLHHAQVFYPPGEEAQARAFYGKALGLNEIRRPETLSDRVGVWYSAPPGHVHLAAGRDLAPHPRRHFALRVDDLEAMRNRLRCYWGVREAHTPSSQGRRRPPEYVFDPFGNKIELDEIGR
jgi:catechol 2,3-dioxygenase-like lactoylglutathione lyase family enzyme